jgi:hypothetical protein
VLRVLWSYTKLAVVELVQVFEEGSFRGEYLTQGFAMKAARMRDTSASTSCKGLNNAYVAQLKRLLGTFSYDSPLASRNWKKSLWPKFFDTASPLGNSAAIPTCCELTTPYFAQQTRLIRTIAMGAATSTICKSSLGVRCVQER